MKGITIHFGMVAELCFEKNVDQVVGANPGKAPTASPAVYKGRHVFLGDSVKDQNLKVLECGWEKVPNWPNTYHHPKDLICSEPVTAIKAVAPPGG